MRLVLVLIMAFSANAYADNHPEEGHAKPDKALPANDPIIATCKITAEDIGKLQDRAKMLEEQADIDLNASRPLVNPQVQGQLLETWRFMMENAEYYKQTAASLKLSPRSDDEEDEAREKGLVRLGTSKALITGVAWPFFHASVSNCFN